MNIAHVTDSMEMGGAEKLTAMLCRLQRARGHHASVHCLYSVGVLGDELRDEAKELVGLAPDVFLAMAPPSVVALQKVTHTVPIVFAAVTDPVGLGIVQSLAHPGGNITGFINIEGSVSGKWIEILKDIVPDASRAALMYNPETAPYFEYYRQPFEAAARSSGGMP